MHMFRHAGCFAKAPGSFVRVIAVLGIVAAAAVSAGCKVDSSEIDALTVDTTTGSSTDSSTSATSTTSTTSTTAAGADALDLSTVSTWVLPSLPGVSASELVGASVTATINSASTDGKNLYTSYEKYSFPASDGTDAVCYFFYESGGKVMGGKFDWWRTGGQGTKTLENVHDGYGGHRMPSEGTKCWTMFSSKDGSQRSNTCAVTWK